ncbi:MAG: universal stress protein [Flavobacteriales bacterium]|nr:universal stress protein [Flavobacteriales bacterium]MCC6937703.1 universal stress protein [Flavobacteriales bacterium]
MAHLLLPTDFSDTSLTAARFAFAHFGGSRSTATLVHAYLTPSTAHAMFPEMASAAKRQAMAQLLTFQHKCQTHAGSTQLVRKATTMWLPEALDRLAKEKGGDWIIMGAHGVGENKLVGSQAMDVVTNAHLPVIIVPGQWEPEPIKRILLAYDGGPVDAAALKPLLALAKRKKAHIVIAHVRTNDIAFEPNADRVAFAKLLGSALHSFVVVQAAEIAPTIDELARTGHIQLVVSIHRKRGSWKGLLHRSKTKRMALHTSIPLLVLRCVG